MQLCKFEFYVGGHIDFPFLIGIEKHKTVQSWKFKFSGNKFVFSWLIMYILKVPGD
jgi:hypothetical protein